MTFTTSPAFAHRAAEIARDDSTLEAKRADAALDALNKLHCAEGDSKLEQLLDAAKRAADNAWLRAGQARVIAERNILTLEDADEAQRHANSGRASRRIAQRWLAEAVEALLDRDEFSDE